MTTDNITTIPDHDQQVAVIHNSIELFRSAPEVLKANQDRSRKAVIVGNNIINQWVAAWQIEDTDERLKALAAADERSNSFLANCSKALKEEKELRAAITQMMDEFKKMFTSAENEIDKTKAGSVADRIQGNRDKYVKEAARIQEEKRREAERIANKQKEEIEIRAKVQVVLAETFAAALADKKQGMLNAFNAITLDSYDQKSVALGNVNPAIDAEALGMGIVKKASDRLPSNIRFQYHETHEVEAICNAAVEAYQWDKAAEDWRLAISEMKQDLIEKLPSKLAELQEQKRLADDQAAEAERQRIAEENRQKELDAAKKEDRKKLEEKQRNEREQEQKRLAYLKAEQNRVAEEQRKREAEGAERIANKQKEENQKAEQDAALKAEGDKTMVMYEQEAAIADTAVAPEARQGFDIEILHPAAYVQIFQLWFENEGKNLPIDKIGNTKMDQMKSWCEKHAHKSGEKIESRFMKYEPSFKAVNRKK